jgi:hypothetical protein
MKVLLERWLATLLVWLSRVLPTERRDWLAAMTAEADALPAGRHRLTWLLGGVPYSTRSRSSWPSPVHRPSRPRSWHAITT